MAADGESTSVPPGGVGSVVVSPGGVGSVVVSPGGVGSVVVSPEGDGLAFRLLCLAVDAAYRQ